MTTYGLTANGFNTKPLQQIITELQDDIRGVFGNNINFAPSSNFGQLVGIYSEREALLWQLLEAVYASQYPGGAEGSSVDNILALNNMRRNSASASRTNPTPVVQSNGITLFGLLAFGSPGTVVPAGSIIQTSDTPPLLFTIDSDIIIQQAINAIQGIYFSNVPTSGAFSLLMPNGVVTPSIPFNALPQNGLVNFSAVPTSGTFVLSFTIAGVTVNTPALAYNASLASIQSAVQALSGLSSVSVTGSYSSGFIFNFSGCCNPLISFTNSTDATITATQSVQAQINNTLSGGHYPYTDATVVVSSQGYAVTFGNGYLVSGQTSCGSQPVGLIGIDSNTLENSPRVTNINIVNSTAGAKAQGSGSATCISTGPNFVSANALDSIGTPISGWNSVVNQLDCITGTAVESDAQALIRRSANLEANANGPLLSIVEKVRAITNVVNAIGIENVHLAAYQILGISGTSSSGTFQLSIDGLLTPTIPYNPTAAQVQTAVASVSGYSNTLVTGDAINGFTINFNGSLGGKQIPLMSVINNLTGLTITMAYGLPGKSFEVIVQGGDDTTIAQTILGAKPGGMQSWGSTNITVYDSLSNAYSIGFSRPTPVPIYGSIVLVTDLTTALNPQFNVESISTIQQDLVNIGNAVGIGGLIIGFGTNGLIGAFNSVPGIISYTLNFGRSPNPTTNSNIQLLQNQSPVFETFLWSISYT